MMHTKLLMQLLYHLWILGQILLGCRQVTPWLGKVHEETLILLFILLRKLVYADDNQNDY